MTGTRKIKFGPAGLGPVKEAEKNLKAISKNGLEACEIAFTYGAYIKPEEAVKISKMSKKLGVELTIHSPYWINLNSADKKKIEQSKKRILHSCEIGNLLGATTVVFHPGYYGKMNKEAAFQNIKKAVSEIMTEIKKKKWKIKISAETTGKVNVFGGASEILRLNKETGCGVCVDFAHLKARSLGKLSYKEMFEKFKHLKNLHCHFSGIEYGNKGEKKHKITPVKEIKKLLKVLHNNKNLKNKKIIIINESPSPFSDSIKMLSLWNEIKSSSKGVTTTREL